jgi:hypothetical protein
LAARIEWLRTQAQIARKKLELVVEHIDTLVERDPE